MFSAVGWDEGCLTMRQGETSRLRIAGHKGYGPQGFPAWGYPLLKSELFLSCVFLCYISLHLQFVEFKFHTLLLSLIR